MISKEEYIVIYTLHKQGHSIRAIARITGLHRNTIAKRLKQTEFKAYKSREYKSILDPCKDYIKQRFYETLPYFIPSNVIMQEIKKQGCNGKIRIVQSYLSSLKQDKHYKENEPLIRFETPKGYQAQVDWTTIRSGKNPIYAFVMVLGYSRYAFVYFTDNMRGQTFQDCHLKAFDYLGGVPQTILYDNLKSVIIERDYYGNGKHKFNNEFLDFCKGIFVPKVCKPFRAKTKGKVERFNHYLKNNFYYPLRSKLNSIGISVTFDLLNSHIFSWLESANSTIHSTTNTRPSDLLKLEAPYLNKNHKNIIPLNKDLTQNKKSKLIPKLNSANIPNLEIIYHTKISDYEKLLVEGVI